MLRSQFLCHVLKTIFLLNSTKIKLFLQKKSKGFERWGPRPQTPKLPPPLRISGYAPGCETRIVEKWQSSQFPKQSSSSFSPTVSLYGHESWVMTKRGRSQVQASKMRFLQTIEGVTLLTRCTSLEIQKSFRAFTSLKLKDLSVDGLPIKSRMPQEKLPIKLCLPKQMGKKQLNYLELDKSILH